jgi:hypothetical protein
MTLSRTAVLLMFATIVLVTACARQPDSARSSISSATQTSDEPKLPFDVHPAQNGGISPTSSLVPAVHNVPAGTPLVIRLDSPLSAATARPGDSFGAVLDEPIVIEGKTAVPAGTHVKGIVVARKPASGVSARGYLRLKLTSVIFAGKELPMETSSIFAKTGSPERRRSGSSQAATADMPQVNTEASTPAREAKKAKKDAQFGAQRRLTFRLTAPMAVPS